MSTKEAIKRVENAEKELKLAREAMQEETYSIGDRFKCDGDKCILVDLGSRNTTMITLSTGLYHNGPIRVSDIYKITKAELGTICYCKKTRYFSIQEST